MEARGRASPIATPRPRRSRVGTAAPNPSEKVLGGSPLDGIVQVLRSPYLLGICVFLLLFTIGSAFLYGMVLRAVELAFPDDTLHPAIFARMDLAVNILTLLTQLFLTGRIVKRLGVGLTLALLPLLSMAGFLTLAVAPVFAVIVVFNVLRRAGNFAIAVPMREVLYTVLSRRDKYKAKNFNDTFVYRTGDLAGIWSFGALDLRRPRHVGPGVDDGAGGRGVGDGVAVAGQTAAGTGGNRGLAGRRLPRGRETAPSVCP